VWCRMVGSGDFFRGDHDVANHKQNFTTSVSLQMRQLRKNELTTKHIHSQGPAMSTSNCIL